MDELIARLKERAADPKRRTDAPQSVSLRGRGGTLTTMFGSLAAGPSGTSSTLGSGPMTLGSLLGDLRRVVVANQAGRPVDPDIRERADAMQASMKTDNATDLPTPADPATLARAEAALGSPLPEDMRRLYSEVADGGFGPGGGLLSIDRVVARYGELRADPPGPRGQRWPDGLLPIQEVEPGYACLEIATGRVVDWDPEELAERSGDRAWRRSFREAAPSLRVWLDGWVVSRPQHELLQERMNDSMIDEARKARAMIAAKTPEERRAMGLPDVGWERVVWGGIGLEDDPPETN